MSEVTVPGTRILQGARAVDQDQLGPYSTVEYHVLQGPYSSYVQFISPLEGTLVLKKTLDYETLKNFTVKLRAQDQGTPPKFTDTILNVVVVDADDQNPKFYHDSYYAYVSIDSMSNVLSKILPEQIKAFDQDIGINAPLEYSINPSLEAKYFTIHPKTAVLNLSTPLATFDFQHTITLVIKATQIDNTDRYALTTLLITKKGKFESNEPLSFAKPHFYARVKEDLGVGSRILSLIANKNPLNYTIIEKDQNQYFKISDSGEIILKEQLDFETKTVHSFKVHATDGTSNATTDITIEVLDVNDWEPRFRHTHYEFIIPRDKMESEEPIALGKLEAADGDRNDKVMINIKGHHASMFLVDTKGTLWLKGLRPNISTTHVLAVSSL